MELQFMTLKRQTRDLSFSPNTMTDNNKRLMCWQCFLIDFLLINKIIYRFAVALDSSYEDVDTVNYGNIMNESESEVTEKESGPKTPLYKELREAEIMNLKKS